MTDIGFKDGYPYIAKYIQNEKLVVMFLEPNHLVVVNEVTEYDGWEQGTHHCHTEKNFEENFRRVNGNRKSG